MFLMLGVRFCNSGITGKAPVVTEDVQHKIVMHCHRESQCNSVRRSAAWIKKYRGLGSDVRGKGLGQGWPGHSCQFSETGCHLQDSRSGAHVTNLAVFAVCFFRQPTLTASFQRGQGGAGGHNDAQSKHLPHGRAFITQATLQCMPCTLALSAGG
eukprot:366519-Chlamydomonas_euryale.AAC.12